MLVKAGLLITLFYITIFGIINIFHSHSHSLKIIANHNDMNLIEHAAQYGNYSFYIFIAYIVIVSALLCHILYSYLGARKQLSGSVKVAILGKTVFLNKAINSPLCFGVFKGKIYFPYNYLEIWTKREIELSLAHEEIHQTQYDPFWILLSLTLRSFLFFLPCAYILHRRFKLEIEICCDQSTCAKTNADIKEYSNLLLAMVCNQQHNFIYANIRNSNLKRRLIAMKSKKITRPFLSGTLAFLLLSSAGAAIAEANVISIKKILFDSGDSYEITIKNNNLTWKGLAGEDKNIVSNNHVKHISFSKDVDLFQWNDNKTDTFVTLMLDQKNHQAVCSSKGKDNRQWFMQGKIID